MSVPLKTPPNGSGSPFYTRRVQIVLVQENGATESRFQVQHRSRWWPFWRNEGATHRTANAAIEVAKASLAVDDFLSRRAIEPLVVWKG